MTNHLYTLVEGQFKKEPGNFVLTSFTNFAGNPAPHVGEENEILQCPPTFRHSAILYHEVLRVRVQIVGVTNSLIVCKCS